MTNYLDDFLFVALTLMKCNWMIRQFLDLCEELGVPVALEKTEWGSEVITFLGILLDGYHLILALPLEKKETAIELLLQMKSRRKTTVKELQKLCGLLNFVSCAVFPGHTFTRRMYSKFAGVINVGSATDTKQQFTSKLKQYHHVSLDAEFRSDCEIWLQFLQGDLQKVVNRPMVDLLGTLSMSEQVGFYSDASASEILGFGALLNMHWIRGAWEMEFI